MSQIATTEHVMPEADARRLTEKIREAVREMNHASSLHAAAESRLPGRSRDQGQHLYLMQIGDIGPVKIGVANDVESRRRTLQTATPYPLHVRIVLSDRGYREQEMHNMFSFFRMKGEWFEPIEEIFDWFYMEAI